MEGTERFNPLAERTPEQIIEAEISWIASLVLFFLTIYAAIQMDVLWTVFGVTAISLYILPIVSTRDPFRALPWEMTLVLSLPIILHFSEGSQVLGENISWWTDFTSLAFSFSIATIGFLLTVEVQIYTDVKMNRPFAVVFVVVFTMAISGFWELGLYVADLIYDTSNQGTNRDVMMVFVWSLVGGILMGMLYDAYLKAMSEKRRKTLGFIHLWEVHKWNRG